MPKIHCSRKCLHNRNSDDHCELPEIARVYQTGVCCSGFRPRPLPIPPPMIGKLDTYDTGKRGGKRERLLK